MLNALQSLIRRGMTASVVTAWRILEWRSIPAVDALIPRDQTLCSLARTAAGNAMATTKWMNVHNVFPRRYFFPSLNEVNAIQQYTPCPVSEDLSRRILCLPIYKGLSLLNIMHSTFRFLDQ